MRPRLYLAYSIGLLVVGVVLLAVTGSAGIILIAGGLIGLILNVRAIRRR